MAIQEETAQQLQAIVAAIDEGQLVACWPRRSKPQPSQQPGPQLSERGSTLKRHRGEHRHGAGRPVGSGRERLLRPECVEAWIRGSDHPWVVKRLP